MKAFLRFLVLLVALTCGGCSSDYRVHLGAEVLELAYLTGDGHPIEWKLGPEYAEHQRLSKWIDSNQDGWSSYVATTPGTGLLVDAKEWRLQFLEDSVLVCPRKKGCWIKPIKRHEYEYLLQTGPK